MPRTQKHHVITDAPNNAATADAPRHLSKQEFGRRLETLMNNKMINQSELARRAGLPRNNVSTYIRGRSYPTEQNLVRLAKALGVGPDDLLPNRAEMAIRGEAHPDLSMTSSVADPGKAWLIVNRQVSTSLAARIMVMLEDDRQTGA